jgi:MFS transporter, CP family, cyanate transporter
MTSGIHRETDRRATTGVPVALFMLFLVALNLRTGMIGVGPLMPDVTDDLSLSSTSASLLVALPPLLMGLGAVPGGRLADRLGPRLTITFGLAVVAVAGGLRAVAPTFALLVVLTTLFGAGIGITQPALPRLSRGILPTRIGLATGVYAGGFFAGAVIPAFLTAPLFLSESKDSDWRAPLGVWGVLAAISLVAWLMSLRYWHAAERPSRVPDTSPSVSGGSQAAGAWTPWRDRKTWVVAGVFAGQGLSYYLLIAWLPTVYENLAISKTEAGILFTVFNVATFPAMVGMPILSDHIGSRRVPTMLAAFVFLIGSIGLAIDPVATGVRWIWPPLAGFGVAGLFGMGLLMPADTAREGKMGQTAGMVLAIGYLASGAGPVVGGAIRDLTGSFEAALWLLPLIALAMIALAWISPRPRSIEQIHS